MRTLIISAVVLMITFAGSADRAAAQSVAPRSKSVSERTPGKKRPNLFQALGVTPEQRQQIRTLRREAREDYTTAQQRLREASKALDAAIYSDVLDEPLIEQLILQRNEAEAALSRLKTMSELNLRKILTPEQVAKFREIRSRFARREAERRRTRHGRPDTAPKANDEMPPPPDEADLPDGDN